MRPFQIILALFAASTLALPIAPRSDPLAALITALTNLLDPSASSSSSSTTSSTAPITPDIAAWKRTKETPAWKVRRAEETVGPAWKDKREAEAAVAETKNTASSAKAGLAPAVAAWKQKREAYAEAEAELETIIYEGIASAPIEVRGEEVEAAKVKPEVPAW